MQLRAVEHIGLAARHPANLKDWYLMALGAKLIFQTDTTPAAYFVELPGGLLLEIYQASSSLQETADNTLAGWRHIALRVDSLTNARAQLEKYGVKFSEPTKPASGGGRVLFFQDHEGNLLHLVERPADSVLGR